MAMLFLSQFVSSWKKCLSYVLTSLNISHIFVIVLYCDWFQSISMLITEVTHCWDDTAYWSTCLLLVWPPLRVLKSPLTESYVTLFCFHNLQNFLVFLSDFVWQYHSSILQYYVHCVVWKVLRKAVHRHFVCVCVYMCVSFTIS